MTGAGDVMPLPRTFMTTLVPVAMLNVALLPRLKLFTLMFAVLLPPPVPAWIVRFVVDASERLPNVSGAAPWVVMVMLLPLATQPAPMFAATNVRHHAPLDDTVVLVIGVGIAGATGVS